MTTADLKSSSFMVRAFSMGGWWNFHSRKVPRATLFPELVATETVAQGVAHV